MSTTAANQRTITQIARQSRRGAIVVLIAFCLTIILAFVAIAIDGGGLLDDRRQAQATADAAALAAAENLFVNYPKNKGLDSGGTTLPNRSPTPLPRPTAFTTTAPIERDRARAPADLSSAAPKGHGTIPKGYVEVTVQYNQSRYFSAVIGSGAIPVSARAVARGKWEPAFVGYPRARFASKGLARCNGRPAAVNVTGGARSS